MRISRAWTPARCSSAWRTCARYPSARRSATSAPSTSWRSSSSPSARLAGEAYVRSRLAMQRILAEDGRPAGELHVAFGGFSADAFGALQHVARSHPRSLEMLASSEPTIAPLSKGAAVRCFRVTFGGALRTGGRADPGCRRRAGASRAWRRGARSSRCTRRAARAPALGSTSRYRSTSGSWHGPRRARGRPRLRQRRLRGARRMRAQRRPPGPAHPDGADDRARRSCAPTSKTSGPHRERDRRARRSAHLRRDQRRPRLGHSSRHGPRRPRRWQSLRTAAPSSRSSNARRHQTPWFVSAASISHRSGAGRWWGFAKPSMERYSDQILRMLLFDERVLDGLDDPTRGHRRRARRRDR